MKANIDIWSKMGWKPRPPVLWKSIHTQTATTCANFLFAVLYNVTLLLLLLLNIDLCYYHLLWQVQHCILQLLMSDDKDFTVFVKCFMWIHSCNIDSLCWWKLGYIVKDNHALNLGHFTVTLLWCIQITSEFIQCSLQYCQRISNSFDKAYIWQ